jgi:aspartyl-tRNA(Asn)/glutamyl-tRNA(Gln) amidotransferase subunit A
VKLNTLTLKRANELLVKKEVTAKEIWEACRNEMVARKNLNVYLSETNNFTHEEGEWRGLPIAIKDNFCTKDDFTTASSNILRGFKPPYDATVVSKLRKAGFSFLGKTNLDAFAHGSSTETSDFGVTLNPRNYEHLPGGSSGGSAAAVAADMCLASLGSETAGSVRQPAAWCGCVGLRPTYGTASRYGMAAMMSSTDTPGVLAKTVEDSAIFINIISGHDPLDGTTSNRQLPNLTKCLNKNIKGKKIGLIYLDTPGFESVKPHYESAAKVLEQLGAIVETAVARDPREAIALYTVAMRSEVSSNLARYDGIRYGHPRSDFGDEAKRRTMMGTFTLSKGYADRYYIKAQQVRTLFVEDFKKLFSKYDVLISPASTGFAQKVGASANNPLFGELEDIMVEPSALSGLPAISVPCYHDPATNLYLGLNIMGQKYDEENVVQVAHAFEQATNWNSWLREVENV